MRVGLSWPIPPGREDRALRSAIIDRVRAGFQENKQETNPAKITALLKYAKEQLLALETIHKNKFSSMVLVAEISVISNVFHPVPFHRHEQNTKSCKESCNDFNWKEASTQRLTAHSCTLIKHLSLKSIAPFLRVLSVPLVPYLFSPVVCQVPLVFLERLHSADFVCMVRTTESNV